MPNAPLIYNDNLEVLRDDELETEAQLNETFDRILETTFKDYGHAVRAVHAKAHGILRGELTVLPNLPPELSQGLFSQPLAYPAYMRISTNPGDILDDAIALPRGLALKIVGVPGERLPGAEGGAQDFIMINAPAFVTPDAKSFAGNLKVLAPTTDRAETTKIALSKVLQVVNAALGAVGLESGKLAAMGGAPQSEPLGETYFSATPFRFGDYVAKFRLRPIAPDLIALQGKTVATQGRRDALRETLKQEMAAIDAAWMFEVQLARDLARQPIEDASVVWDEREAPFAPVAVLKAPRQDSYAPDLVQEVNETMRFSPWTGLSAHRPLGNVNRARRSAYHHSADFRASANRCPIHEP